MSNDPFLHALHILEAIAYVKQYIKIDEELETRLVYHACLRELQTLSESTQFLDVPIKEQNIQIPWGKIKGFRNILVHDYLGDVDSFVVKNIINNELEILQEAIVRYYAKDQIHELIEKIQERVAKENVFLKIVKEDL